MDLETVVLIDILVLVSCGSLILWKGVAGHSHPAVIYLIFHVFVVTSRAYAIQNGAPTFLSGVSGFEGATESEISRAVLFADVALLAATLGWMSASKRNARKLHPVDRGPQDTFDSKKRSDVNGHRMLRYRLFCYVAVLAMPIGLFTMARYGYVPGRGSPAEAARSSYSTFALTWPGLVLTGFIYFRGFRARFVVPMAFYFSIIALQGYGRFRLILPLILLAQIYLDRRERRWPNLRVGSVLLIGALLFFPLKEFGRSIQSGEDLRTVRSGVSTSVSRGLSGQSGDEALLDQFAMSLSLTDESGKVFWGKPYLSVLTLPVPREFWDDKPGLADQLKVISTPARPLSELGGITTIAGDLYLNFRLPGVILFMFLFARWSAKLYAAAYRRQYRSVGRFAFLLFSSNLLVVYRDGLTSLPVFLLVQMLPLVVVLLLHAGRRRPSESVADAGWQGERQANGLRATACRR